MGAVTSERRTISETVGSALSRGNLRYRETPCDLDKVMALGMVGIREHLADAVFRVKYANDAKSYAHALAGVVKLASAMNAQGRWRMRRRSLRWLARRVFDFWLADTCPHCVGRRFHVIIGTPHLSDDTCGHCNGSGKRAMPWLRKVPRRPEGKRATRERLEKWKRVRQVLLHNEERHLAILVALERFEREVGEKMVAKLARDVRER